MGIDSPVTVASLKNHVALIEYEISFSLRERESEKSHILKITILKTYRRDCDRT